ncbi:MAG: hypothetical protein LAO55_03000 [Acidobacteriia bacterium]|nr:hypothetical protein [Terriglobia bacterium]
MTCLFRTTWPATVVLFVLIAPAGAQQGLSGADWRYISGDAGGTKYSPLAQIDASNVSKLKIAWRWKSENYGPRPDFNLEATPLAINGKLFFTAGAQLTFFTSWDGSAPTRPDCAVSAELGAAASMKSK